MEMEESFPCEKIYPDLKRAYKVGGRKSRASMSDYTIDETNDISNADAYLLQTDERPVKVRFSVSSKLDAHDSVAKTGQRDKRKGKLSDVILPDVDVDSDRQLIIDEPRFGSRGQGHEKPLRMKLSMSSNMTASITSSDTVAAGKLPPSVRIVYQCLCVCRGIIDVSISIMWLLCEIYPTLQCYSLFYL